VKANEKHFDNVTVCRIKYMYSGKFIYRRIEEKHLDSARLRGCAGFAGNKPVETIS
jgi:hypothetical protein